MEYIALAVGVGTVAAGLWIGVRGCWTLVRQAIRATRARED